MHIFSVVQTSMNILLRHQNKYENKTTRVRVFYAPYNENFTLLVTKQRSLKTIFFKALYLTNVNKRWIWFLIKTKNYQLKLIQSESKCRIYLFEAKLQVVRRCKK